MKITSAFVAIASLVSGAFQSSAQPTDLGIKNLYDIEVTSLEGDPINLADYKGKKILFVNVASKCGFTPQYAELQDLHKKHGDKLVIIGAPCNQFGKQEPGSAEEIQTFCERNYGVEFLITEKLDVKGEAQHPLYQWLTQKENNGVEDTKVKWNFNKYLVDESGNYLAKYNSTVKPFDEEIISKL